MTNLNGSPNELDDLKKVFADYHKKSQAQGSKRKSREEILKKYFVPRNSTETFRILPPLPGRKRIEEAFFHSVPTLTVGGKKKHGTVLYCPAHNDPKVPKMGADGKPILDQNNNPVLVPAPCPLCAEYKNRLAKQDPSIKGIKKEDMNPTQLEIKAKNDAIYKEAIVWEAKKYYILRGIDKGAQKDGVKFWRFKHNYLNKGTLDSLLPVLEQYHAKFNADFSDPENGTDLSILMGESSFKTATGVRTYKTVTGIIYDGKSSLSDDPVVKKVWLADDITWRDVYKPRTAPGITNYEFLEMVAKGTNPYWDDTDANNKHWVFPGRPDLETAANTRKLNLDADADENYEYASDLDEELPRVTINNITEEKVGTYTDNAVNLGDAALAETANVEEDVPETSETPEGSNSGNYDDLPF